mmetsp:Transcript_15662/g.24336  ORF Transcript_15662/g.24336 Transcript_15662/m.24336 type:complete len:81 (+) Transcript_15662:515-757(+)
MKPSTGKAAAQGVGKTEGAPKDMMINTPKAAAKPAAVKADAKAAAPKKEKVVKAPKEWQEIEGATAEDTSYAKAKNPWDT